MKIEIPGRKPFEIDTVILDLNGTLTIDGELINGVAERVEHLKKRNLDLRLFTGDTLGNGVIIAERLGLTLHITQNSKAKAEEAKRISSSRIAAIGNGRIDFELFQCAALRICTLQSEGVFAPLLTETDVLVTSITDALDLFIKQNRLIATLRK